MPAVQETTGKDLSDLSPDILKRFLNYSSKSVVFLSPTDSIIESIRCAIELNIPLYGVDLEDTADAIRKDQKIQDPTGIQELTLRKYIERNFRHAEYSRDDEIDSRREFAIAARLKSVLKNHNHVLFTCGLAHWKKIEYLLRDINIKPAPIPELKETIPYDFFRCIVHPILAIYFI